MHRVLLSALVLSPAVAHAFDSEQREFLFADAFDVFDGIEDIHYGPYPADAVLGLEFELKSRGGYTVEMEATSDLTWPDALTHDLKGVPQGGEIALDTTLSAYLTLNFDTSLFSGHYDLWSEHIKMQGEEVFDGLLLDGDTVETVDVVWEDYPLDPIELPLSIVTGLTVKFVMNVYPRSTITLDNERIETFAGDATDPTVLTAVGTTSIVEVPEDNPGEVWLESTYFANLAATGDIVFDPAADICIFGGCWTVFNYELPFTILDVQELREFWPVEYDHPLPAILVDVQNHDYGDIELGNLAQLNVPIENIGLLPLEGTVRVEGSDAITVFPEYFFADAGAIDGVVVTFSPELEEGTTAMLVLESNDPVTPRIEIPLLGNGWVEPDLEEYPDGNDGGDPVKIRTCGCQSTPTPLPMGAWALALAFVAGRRRRG